MKVNEAPEKIYVHKSQYWGLMANEHNITKNDIEYTRTDAFMKKAERYIRSVADGLDRDDDVEAFINEFKKYMKEE